MEPAYPSRVSAVNQDLVSKKMLSIFLSHNSFCRCAGKVLSCQKQHDKRLQDRQRRHRHRCSQRRQRHLCRHRRQSRHR